MKRGGGKGEVTLVCRSRGHRGTPKWGLQAVPSTVLSKSSFTAVLERRVGVVKYGLKRAPAILFLFLRKFQICLQSHQTRSTVVKKWKTLILPRLALSTIVIILLPRCVPLLSIIQSYSDNNSNFSRFYNRADQELVDYEFTAVHLLHLARHLSVRRASRPPAAPALGAVPHGCFSPGGRASRPPQPWGP